MAVTVFDFADTLLSASVVVMVFEVVDTLLVTSCKLSGESIAELECRLGLVLRLSSVFGDVILVIFVFACFDMDCCLSMVL